MKVAIIQFASASIHIGASLEILHNESMENESLYCYWGNSTSYPGRMSANYESFSNHFPTKLRRLVQEAAPDVILNSKVDSDTEWVELRLRAFMAQMEKITFMYELISLNYDSISPGSALANELTTLLKNRNWEVEAYIVPDGTDQYRDAIHVLLTIDANVRFVIAYE